MLPLVIHSNHWILLHVDRKGRMITVLDPMSKAEDNGEGSRVVPHHEQDIIEVVDEASALQMAIAISSGIPGFNSERVWTTQRWSRYKQQDTFNCGIYAALHV
eukprot:758065-Hanusia_phi.AAC.1